MSQDEAEVKLIAEKKRVRLVDEIFELFASDEKVRRKWDIGQIDGIIRPLLFATYLAQN